MLQSFATGAAVGAAAEGTAALLSNGKLPSAEQVGAAAVQRGLFSLVLGRYFGWLAGAGFSSPFRMLLFDQIVSTWPVNAAFVFSHSLIVQRRSLSEAVGALRQLPRVVLSGMAVWGPANAISMFYIPAQYRMYWSLVIGYFWGVYLALKQKSSRKPQK